MSFLVLDKIKVGYDRETTILEDFSLDVEKGEFVSLLGPSGCGKTTTLRAIAGFLPIKGGKLLVDGKIYNSVPPNKRNMGFVFQNYALFPHLTIFENVAFGLKMRRVPQDQIREKVLRALSFVGLSGYEERFPAQLSGGQQQRVAIARAIVIEPDLLLMDEPLSNLDAKLRIQMRTELARMQRELGITTIYVTHDQAEALALSDRVAVINRGKIEQYDTPEVLYHTPKTLFVAKFVGFEDFFSGEVAFVEDRFVEVVNEKGERVKGLAMDKLSPHDRVIVLTRARYLEIGNEGGTYALEGKIVSRIFQGETVLYVVERDIPISVDIPIDEAMWKRGDRVDILYHPDKLLVYRSP